METHERAKKSETTADSECLFRSLDEDLVPELIGDALSSTKERTNVDKTVKMCDDAQENIVGRANRFVLFVSKDASRTDLFKANETRICR